MTCSVLGEAADILDCLASSSILRFVIPARVFVITPIQESTGISYKKSVTDSRSEEPRKNPALSSLPSSAAASPSSSSDGGGEQSLEVASTRSQAFGILPLRT